MLYPKMNQARSVIDLSGVWEFWLGTDVEPAPMQFRVSTTACRKCSARNTRWSRSGILRILPPFRAA